ncbi:MAG: ABC transporter substrate-binding protein [Candidatus Tectomicrobia bacterium]|uniref:ABC transporter substrate-binding protein n=1 Tax=Tectimicrobiota bacterium TaxID=2528274 RepID=A0A932ZSU2_UNCTE|nr:ABC transporter substrate-binding protein [Candidatus Tectomicrobia bacterium]
MKRGPIIPLLSAPLVLALALAAPAGGATPITPQEKKLIPAVKKEGSVVFLQTSFNDQTTQKLGAVLAKRYGLGEGFKLVSVQKGTGPTVSQARQEIRAGKFTFDIVTVASAGFFAGAAKQGAFQPLDSGQWKNHEENWKKAGIYYQYPLFISPYSYTFQPVWNTACPGMEGVNITSYRDIVDNPKLKGKVLVSDVTKSTSYSLTTIGLMENGIDVKGMWPKLKALDPLVAFRTEAKMQLIINCERAVDMWNLSGRALQKIRAKPELGKGLKWGTYKEGMVLFGQQAGVIKGAAHPNAAKLFLDFLLTKEAADIVAEGEDSFYTMLKGYKPPESVRKYMIDFDSVKTLPIKDQLGAAKKFKQMHADWQKVFR